MAKLDRRRFVQASSVVPTLAMLGVFSDPAGAQEATLETVRIVTGFPPGGNSDALCRRVAEALRGTPYTRIAIVDNKVGAGGQIAVQSMKGAPTDGSVILMTPASMLMIYPHIYKQLPYDVFADVAAVTLACTFDFAFCVGPAVPDNVKDVADFMSWCRANPASANYGSPATGSLPHFIGVLLAQAGGVALNHVPYRGMQPAVQDLVGGQVQAVSGPLGEFMQHAHAGKVRLLAVSGAARSQFAPNVPTLSEQGYKELVFSEWFGFFAPGATPAPVVKRANGVIRTALARADVGDALRALGLEVKSSSPEELATLLRESHDRWGPIVRKIGFTIDS